jgi:hypothetical protein
MLVSVFCDAKLFTDLQPQLAGPTIVPRLLCIGHAPSHLHSKKIPSGVAPDIFAARRRLGFAAKDLDRADLS